MRLVLKTGVTCYLIVCSCFGTTDREIRDAMRAENPGMFPAGTC